MILRAEHLFKKYKARAVVNDVSVYVEQGEIVGLLGPNGAGKTTTFYMIVGLIQPVGNKRGKGAKWEAGFAHPEGFLPKELISKQIYPGENNS